MSIDLRNKFDFAGNGVTGTATKNTTTDIDFKLPANLWLSGGEVLVKDHVFGDWFEIQVIDIDNVLGGGANVVLKTYVNKWYVHPSVFCEELESPYAGEVLKDLYIRVKYHSTGITTDVSLSANYKLHTLT